MGSKECKDVGGMAQMVDQNDLLAVLLETELVF